MASTHQAICAIQRIIAITARDHKVIFFIKPVEQNSFREVFKNLTNNWVIATCDDFTVKRNFHCEIKKGLLHVFVSFVVI
ncbi:hypothetical protein D3C86_1977660 [compost metagenome]